MSRLVQAEVRVTESPTGQPEQIVWDGDRFAVLQVLDRWREWYGILEGEPERDVWIVSTERGVCELHHLYPPDEETESEGSPSHLSHLPAQWFLARWMD